MNTHHKPTLTRLAALALTLTLLLGLSVSVNAKEEGYTPANSYVLNYCIDENGNRNNDNAWYYFSVYMAGFNFEENSGITSYIAFSLREDGTDDSELFPVYCTDLGVGIEKGAKYRRLNLEDSTYAGHAAEMLRSIYLNGFPGTTLQEISNASGVENVTVGEAVAATQAAIWKAAHGENAEFTDLCADIDGEWTETMTVKYEESIAEFSNGYATSENQSSIRTRIETIYNYLLALEPTPAQDVVVSEAAFINREITGVSYNDDGTCNITVKATVSAVIDDAEDKLTLTAYLTDGQYYASESMSNGEKEYTLTIKNVPASHANETVTLAIDGAQKAHDVYLFDAVGNRGASQSLIGDLNRTLPVHADIKCEPDRVLNIYKTEKVTDDNGDETRLPLANISFNVYYVGSVEDFRDGKLDIGTAPTEDDITKYAKTSNLVGTITTDESGNGSLNLHTEDGVYLVKELPNEAVENASVAFFVSLPDWSRLDENGNPTYEITAEPKNTTVDEGPDIEKDVTEINNKHDTYDVGEEHPWIIRTGIPKTIASGKSYIITDTLDYRLTFKRLDKVELVDTVTEGAEALVLTEGADYTVTVGTTTDEDNHTVDMFTVSLTTVGMQKIAKAVGNDYADYELRTWFTAQINSNAQMGVEIPNQAEIEYTNNVGKTFTDESGVPEVHTGGAQLNKVNTSGDTLAGATFEVYRMATAEEINAETYDKELLIGETTYKMVKVSFYDNAKCDGEKVDSVTTDASGVACIYGLAYGEYYLVETKAPDGYNKLASPVKFTIDATSHMTERVVMIVNTNGVELPSTGGIGTVPFTVMGLMLLAAAAVLLGRKKRGTI